MRILVTGVTGQIGSAVVRRLHHSPGFYTIIAADRELLDLSKLEAIESALDTLKPDVIVNAAAYTAVDQAEDEPALAFRINAAAPEALARWAASGTVPMIHLSTDYVFDGSGHVPWRENDKVAPLNTYGASKLAGENAVRAANGPHLIVRTSWIYSASGRNFLTTIARQATEREELRVVADQAGSPTPAPLVADTLAAIIEGNRSNLPASFARAHNLVHVAATGHTTWHGFAQAIIVALRDRGIQLRAKHVVAIPSTDYAAKARRPANSRLALARLSDAYGFCPRPWLALLATEIDDLLKFGEARGRG